MANKTVVRNQAYKRSSIGLRERHNERKNECYSNADVRLERSKLNVQFRQCDGTYTDTLDRLRSEGVISTRGLKEDAKIIDEMVFDVNTTYFEENGGYEFAKRFYEEAYRMAVREVGDERYILSAVMHADEVNKAVSAELGKDVYHYHLHVVYVPIVEKEVKWTKRCKDPALVGKVKEVIHQVSHSKKWPRYKSEKGEWVNSYSLLQDRFFQHMREAGFQDFERGDYNSTRQHLSDLEYKIKKDAERVGWLGQIIEEKEANDLDLDVKIKSKETQIVVLDQRLCMCEKSKEDVTLLENIGKKNLLGQIVLTPKELKSVKSLAKEGIQARGKVYDLEHMVMRAKRETQVAKRQCDEWKQRYDGLLSKTKLFLDAIALVPQKVMSFLSKVIEEHELKQQSRQRAHKDRYR